MSPRAQLLALAVLCALQPNAALPPEYIDASEHMADDCGPEPGPRGPAGGAPAAPPGNSLLNLALKALIYVGYGALRALWRAVPGQALEAAARYLYPALARALRSVDRLADLLGYSLLPDA